MAAILAILGPLAASADTIVVVERATSDVVTDTGAKDDSVGDILTFANDMYDAQNKFIVGSDEGYCLRTVVGKTWECAWSTKLYGGLITVQGPFHDGSDSMLAITGGTGIYAGATGQMLLHARNEKGTAYDMTFKLR